MTIKELAENHGSLDLLTAYIMRTVHVSEKDAENVLYGIDEHLECLLKERFEINDNK